MNRIATGKPLTLIVAIVACAMVSPAMAEDGPYPDRWMLRLGGYNASDANTIARLDANDVPVGAYIDFQQTLGGQTSASVVRFDGLYRFNDHHGIGFSTYAMRFNGNRTLGTAIDWGGQTYPIGTTVDSTIKFDIYKVNYQYSVVDNDKVELGGLAGLHIMNISMGINGAAIGQSNTSSVTAPLPVLGMYARYNFTPAFSIYYNYQFFFINYEDKIKGGLQDFLLGLEYRISKHFALGAAFNKFGMNVQSKGDLSTLNVDSNWTGTMLYGSLYF
ncbi:MAG: hypothetical protein ACREVQ_09885 [Burkholderiales bacterium]